MYLFTLNTYACFKNPKVVSNLSCDEWLSQIKHSAYSHQITEARQGQQDYEQVKASLPCVTYNFLFDDYKKDANITDSTGLMYIDIDNSNFDINSIDKDKVYAYYKSFGGTGYAIIIKVSGLTLDNFKATYNYITNDLGITEYVDIQAAKASQFTVLSYDCGLFSNKDAFVYSSATAPRSFVIEREKKAYTLDRGANEFIPLRFDNLDEVEIQSEFVVNWEGIEYIKCFIPMKKIERKRNAFLLSYCNNLMFLNPHLTEQKAFEVLSGVNKAACIKPVQDNQLLRVIRSVFKYKEDGTLKPIYYRKARKIVFSKVSKLTREEKLSICITEMAKKKSSTSQQKMYAIIEAWDFKQHAQISQRKMYKNYPINKKTVEKYWHLFREYITDLNNQHE